MYKKHLYIAAPVISECMLLLETSDHTGHNFATVYVIYMFISLHFSDAVHYLLERNAVANGSD